MEVDDMGVLSIRRDGIYRKVVCPKTGKDVEIFYDCLVCECLSDTSVKDIIECAYPEAQ